MAGVGTNWAMFLVDDLFFVLYEAICLVCGSATWFAAIDQSRMAITTPYYQAICMCIFTITSKQMV
jgi:hypothetical protein